jgi:hypothetical protein
MNNTVYYSSSAKATFVSKYEHDYVFGNIFMWKDGDVRIYYAEKPAYVIVDGNRKVFTYDPNSKLVNIQLSNGYHDFFIVSEGGYELIRSLLTNIKTEIENIKFPQARARALRLYITVMESFDEGNLYNVVRNLGKISELIQRINKEGPALGMIEEASQSIRKAERLEGRVVGIEDAKVFLEKAKKAFKLEDYAEAFSLASRAKELADEAETYLQAYGQYIAIILFMFIAVLIFTYRRMLRSYV